MKKLGRQIVNLGMVCAFVLLGMPQFTETTAYSKTQNTNASRDLGLDFEINIGVAYDLACSQVFNGSTPMDTVYIVSLRSSTSRPNYPAGPEVHSWRMNVMNLDWLDFTTGGFQTAKILSGSVESPQNLVVHLNVPPAGVDELFIKSFSFNYVDHIIGGKTLRLSELRTMDKFDNVEYIPCKLVSEIFVGVGA